MPALRRRRNRDAPQESFVTNRKGSSIALSKARSPGSCRAIWRARFVHARIGTTLFPTLLGPLVAKVAQACINRLSFFEELATPVSGLDFVAHLVSQSHFRNDVGKTGALACPIFER